MNLYQRGMLQFEGFCSKSKKSNHGNVLSDLYNYTNYIHNHNVYTEEQLLIALDTSSYNSSPSNINLFKHFRNHPELIRLYENLFTSVIGDRYNENIMLASLIRSNPKFDYRFYMTEDARISLMTVINILYDVLDGYIL